MLSGNRLAWTVLLLLTACVRVEAESSHLWWNIKDHPQATCLYGEITVLATHQPIYYCGANWHPGEPAGGYCGIQHNGPKERRTIFSIWDTSSELHPSVTQADPETVHNRFGGEGEGGHTHMLWNWQAGQTFQFLVQKQPGAKANTTDARYYVFDLKLRRWRHSATITNPNGDAKSTSSVATIGGGGLCSFLENFGGAKDKNVPKLALYRLWLGTKPSDLKCLTEVAGDGQWGTLGDCYYMAEGGAAELAVVFRQWKDKLGDPTVGERNKKLPPISAKPLAPELIQALEATIHHQPESNQRPR